MSVSFKRLTLALEKRCQLDLFQNNEEQAAKALKALKELKQKRSPGEEETPGRHIKTKGTTADPMSHPAAEGKRGRPC